MQIGDPLKGLGVDVDVGFLFLLDLLPPRRSGPKSNRQQKTNCGSSS